jgi:hypothetical protein
MYSPILAPQVLTNVISQQAAVSEWILNLFGVNHGGDGADPLFDPQLDVAKGQNVLNFGHGRNGSFHVFNNSRGVAKGRAPGAPASKSSLQGMSMVPFTYPRLSDSIDLLAEFFHNLGQIDNPAQRDSQGRRMIELQTKVKAQECANWRKAALIGALRSSLSANRDGEDYNWSFSSGFSVSNQLPSGNRNRLNMLGAGNIISASWALANTNIDAQLNEINRAYQRLCGGALRAMICGSQVWSRMVANDFIKGVAGIANPPFTYLDHQVMPKLATTMKNVKVAKIISQPQLTIYVTDETVQLADGIQQLVPDNFAIFLGCEPSDGTIAMYEGSEPVAEYDGGPEALRFGFHSWMVKKSNPTRTEVYFLDNAMPVIHVPNAVAFGEVVF